MSLTEVIVLAVLTSAFPWLMFFCRHMALARAFLAGMRLRAAYSGLIFRKVSELIVAREWQNVTPSRTVDNATVRGIARSTFQWENSEYADE